MSEGQKLDRSVLEGKKADELRKIAAAAGVPLAGRPTKAGVIDQILQFSGVPMSDEKSTAAVKDRPKRSPRSKSKSSEDVVDVADSGSSASADGSEGDTKSRSRGRSRESGSSQSNQESGSAPGQASDDSNDSKSRESNDSPKGSGDREGKPRNDRQGRQRGFDSYAADGGQGQGPGGSRNSNNNRRRRGRNRNRGERNADYDRQVEQAAAEYEGEVVPVEGIFELRDEGFGFVRTKGMLASAGDVYVPVSQVRKFNIRKGDQVVGTCRPALNNEKYPALMNLTKVSGLDPEVAKHRPRFEDLTPLFPDSKLRLEQPGDPSNMTARIVDLMSPIGKGQRGLIVSPPKAGKTTVMKQIASSIKVNNPDIHLMVLLVDERPEEVTDMRRSVGGEVVASTFDRPAEEHTKVAELALERAKRLVEQGIDVVIILDGITRLARAYNLAAPASGRILSGGVDSGALYPPKKFFGSARNVEEGGSLTILATALVETGSKMDEVIFEEFKGTGNMELRLDRRLAERRLYPAIDANGSSTRHEELLFDRTQLQQVWKLRRVLNALAQDGNTAAGLELLMDKVKTTASNDEFLAEIAKNPTPGG